jgi:hypothetical protein
MKSFLPFLLFLALALARTARIASAASGEIDVTVIDISSKKPIDEARVVLLGALNSSGLTAHDGKLRFIDVPAGIYRLEVVCKGYDGAVVDDFELLSSQRRIFSIALSLRTIGSVRARPTVSEFAIDIDEESVHRRISSDLADALGKIAGVSVDRSAYSSMLEISVRGLDPAQTTVQLNGTNVGGVGSQVLRSISPDLFAGLSVDQQSGAGSLGGTVNFQTLEPTKTWQERLATSYATFNRGQIAASLSGSSGRLGFAAQHAMKSGGGILSGDKFEDRSGLYYSHEDSSWQQADFVKLRWSAGSRFTISSSYLAGAGRFDATCTEFVTAVPCGYGPGNSYYNNSSLLDLKLNTQLGLVAVSVGGNESRYNSTRDFANLVVAGNANPLVTETKAAGGGLYLSATIPLRRHTLALTLNDFGATNSYTPLLGSYQIPSSVGNVFRYAALSDVLKASDHWSFVMISGATNDTADGTALYIGASATLTPKKGTSLKAAVSFSGSTSYFSTVGSFSDPAIARFNCFGGGSAVVQGPPEPAGKSTSVSYQVDYTTTGRLGSIKASAYDIEQHSVPFFATLPVSAISPSDLPVGYIGAIQNGYVAATVCPNQVLDPGRIFVTEQIYGPSQRNRGITMNGQVRLGQVLIFPTYTLNQALLVSGEPRLLITGSPYALGGQLPFRPLHTAGLTIDVPQSRARVEWLANVQWTGANNASSLSPYALVSAGMTYGSRSGRFTLIASNLFQTDSPRLATANLAQPIPLQGGGNWLPIPRTLTPRSFTMLYSVGLGMRPSPPRGTPTAGPKR